MRLLHSVYLPGKLKTRLMTRGIGIGRTGIPTPNNTVFNLCSGYSTESMYKFPLPIVAYLIFDSSG